MITRRGLLPFCNNPERNAVLLRVKFAVHGKFAPSETSPKIQVGTIFALLLK